MKKMMFIAVIMSAMLMPAQMMAKNNRDNAKPRVENRINNKKDFKVAAKRANKKDKFAKARPIKVNDKKFRDNRRAKKPIARARMRKPAPRFKPMPRPIPRPRPLPRPIYHNHCCANDVVETAATIVGMATLAALIAN